MQVEQEVGWTMELCFSVGHYSKKLFVLMRIVVLTTDNREHYKEYSKSVPYFGTAPKAKYLCFKRVGFFQDNGQQVCLNDD